MLNYSAEADEDSKMGLEERRLKEVYKALEMIASFEKGVEVRGGGKGSTGFALKIVSSL